jgi:hypothetical protein
MNNNEQNDNEQNDNEQNGNEQNDNEQNGNEQNGNEQNDKKIKKVNSRLKRSKFVEEKKELSLQILNILGISETNKTFYSHIIDENIDIQTQIYKLDERIKEIYQTSSWSAYKLDTKLERRYLSIIKSVLKASEIQFTSVSQKLRYKGSIINTTLYTIVN